MSSIRVQAPNRDLSDLPDNYFQDLRCKISEKVEARLNEIRGEPPADRVHPKVRDSLTDAQAGQIDDSGFRRRVVGIFANGALRSMFYAAIGKMHPSSEADAFGEIDRIISTCSLEIIQQVASLLRFDEKTQEALRDADYVQIVGDRPILALPQHESWLDVLVLMAVDKRIRFVVGDHPILKPIVESVGGVAVRRSSDNPGSKDNKKERGLVHRRLALALSRLATHRKVLSVFPAGTRSPYGGVGDLKKGAANNALDFSAIIRVENSFGNNQVIPAGFDTFGKMLTELVAGTGRYLFHRVRLLDIWNDSEVSRDDLMAYWASEYLQIGDGEILREQMILDSVIKGLPDDFEIVADEKNFRVKSLRVQAAEYRKTDGQGLSTWEGIGEQARDLLEKEAKKRIDGVIKDQLSARKQRMWSEMGDSAQVEVELGGKRHKMSLGELLNRAHYTGSDHNLSNKKLEAETALNLLFTKKIRSSLVNRITDRVFEMQVEGHIELVEQVREMAVQGDQRAQQMYREYIDVFAPAFYYILNDNEEELYHWTHPRAEQGKPDRHQNSVAHVKALAQLIGRDEMIEIVRCRSEEVRWHILRHIPPKSQKGVTPRLAEWFLSFNSRYQKQGVDFSRTRIAAPVDSRKEGDAVKKLADAQGQLRDKMAAARKKQVEEQLADNPQTSAALAQWLLDYEGVQQNLRRAPRSPDLSPTLGELSGLSQARKGITSSVQSLFPETFSNVEEWELYTLLCGQEDLEENTSAIIGDVEFAALGFYAGGANKEELSKAYAMMPFSRVQGILMNFDERTKGAYQSQIQEVIEVRRKLEKLEADYRKLGKESSDEKKRITAAYLKCRDEELSAAVGNLCQNSLAQKLIAQNAVYNRARDALVAGEALLLSKLSDPAQDYLLSSGTMDVEFKALAQQVRQTWGNYQKAIANGDFNGTRSAKRLYEQAVGVMMNQRGEFLAELLMDRLQERAKDKEKYELNLQFMRRNNRSKYQTENAASQELSEFVLRNAVFMEDNYSHPMSTLAVRAVREIGQRRAVEDFYRAMNRLLFQSEKARAGGNIFAYLSQHAQSLDRAMEEIRDKMRFIRKWLNENKLGDAYESRFSLNTKINSQLGEAVKLVRGFLEPVKTNLLEKIEDRGVEKAVESFFNELIYSEALCFISDLQEDFRKRNLNNVKEGEGEIKPAVSQMRAMEAMQWQVMQGPTLKEKEFGAGHSGLQGLDPAATRLLQMARIDTSGREIILPLAATISRNAQPLSATQYARNVGNFFRALSVALAAFYAAASEKAGHDGEALDNLGWQFGDASSRLTDEISWANSEVQKFLENYRGSVTVLAKHNSWTDFGTTVSLVMNWLHTLFLAAKADLNIPGIQPLIDIFTAPVGSTPIEVKMAVDQQARAMLQGQLAESLRWTRASRLGVVPGGGYSELTMPTVDQLAVWGSSIEALLAQLSSMAVTITSRPWDTARAVAAAKGTDDVLILMQAMTGSFGAFPKPDKVLRLFLSVVNNICAGILPVGILGTPARFNLTEQKYNAYLGALAQRMLLEAVSQPAVWGVDDHAVNELAARDPEIRKLVEEIKKWRAEVGGVPHARRQYASPSSIFLPVALGLSLQGEAQAISSSSLPHLPYDGGSLGGEERKEVVRPTPPSLPEVSLTRPVSPSRFAPVTPIGNLIPERRQPDEEIWNTPAMPNPVVEGGESENWNFERVPLASASVAPMMMGAMWMR